MAGDIGMGSKMKAIDIESLVKQAEDGKGCAVVEQLRPLPFDQVITVLHQMAAQNAKDRAANHDLPPLYYYDAGGSGISEADLYRAQPHTHLLSWGSKLVASELVTDDPDGSVKFECANRDNNYQDSDLKL
jgi:hypothetical protein